MKFRMNVLRRKNLLVLLLISFSFILYACGNKENEVKEDLDKSKVTLNSGAIVVGENGTYKNYDIKDGKYSELNGDQTIVEYDENTNNYIFIKDSKHFVKFNGEDIKIDEANYDFLNLSENGDAVAYMVNDNGYKLKILDLKSKESKFVKEDTQISGNLFDFTGDDKLVYYGIGKDKTNGIFTYDLKTGEEKLLYKLSGGGYVEFLKGYKDGVIIFQQTLDNKKVLKEITKDGEVKVLSEDIEKVKDVIKNNGKYYVLGSFSGDSNSLYELNSDKTYNRLVYDFPKGVDLNKGISITKDGLLLFVGIDEYNKPSIYSYDKNGNVNLVLDGKEDYTFVKIN
ncbi:MAG: hypothetical protein ACRCYH_10645 [Clostridium chrysemydis]